MPIFIVGLVAIVILSVGCYLLGYNAGLGDSQVIRQSLRKQLRQAERQKTELSKWVRSNWPDEYTAYLRGITDGYQQGIDHAQQLIEDTEA